MEKTLDYFSLGQQVKIKGIQDKRLEQRLLGYGICVGSIVELRDIAPLGDPFIIASNTTEIAIRKTDCHFLECELWTK